MAGNVGAQALSRNLDKVLEEGQLTGQLSLHARNLRDFPTSAAKFELSDTVVADLARNRLPSLPVQVCDYGSLEILYLHHNSIRYIPDAVQFLESLTYLDLGRNQLTSLPAALFQLPLEVLLVGHNRLESLSQDVGRLADTLMELDLGCNRLASLPSGLGDLRLLRVLNLRENLLSELPYESVCRLRLDYLDVSCNRLTQLPSDLRLMTSLVDLCVASNPLESPPAKVCTRGRVHIFKWLEVELLRKNKRRGLPDLEWPPCRAASLTRASRLGLNHHDESNKAVPKRRERGSRYNTVGAESGYGSMAEDTYRLSRDLTQQNGCADRSASVVGMRRSPPVGEEAPPPPPESVRGNSGRSSSTSSFKIHQSPNGKLIQSGPHRAISAVQEENITKRDIPPHYAPPPSLLNDGNGNFSPSKVAEKRPETDSLYQNGTGSLSNQRPANLMGRSYCNGSTPGQTPTGSFFDEVMTALNSVGSVAERRQKVPSSLSSCEEGSPTPKATPNKAGNFSYPANQRQDISANHRTPLEIRTNGVQSPSKTSHAGGAIAALAHQETSPNSAAALRNLTLTKSSTINSPKSRATASSAKIAEIYTKSPTRDLPKTSPPASLITTSVTQTAEILTTPKAADQPAASLPKVPATSSSALDSDHLMNQERIEKLPDEKKDSADSGFSETQCPTIKKQPSSSASSSSSESRPNSARTEASNKSGTAVKRSLAPSLSGSKSTTSSKASDSKSRSSVKPSSNGIKPVSQSSSESSLSSTTSNSTSGRKKGPPSSSGSSVISASRPGGSTGGGVPRPGRAPPEPPKATSAAKTTGPTRRLPRDSLATTHAASLRKSADPHVQNAQIENMKKVLESRLGVSLPGERSELAGVLSDGVHLCTFANLLRARLIPSVHSTSENVPTLSSAKCRRNVENFLMACRRLGVPENDVLDQKSLPTVAKTVAALLKQAGGGPKSSKSPPVRSKSDHHIKIAASKSNSNLANNNLTSSKSVDTKKPAGTSNLRNGNRSSRASTGSLAKKSKSSPPRNGANPTSPKVSNV